MNGGMKMSSYNEYKEKALKNPKVKEEYDALQPETTNKCYCLIKSVSIY
jgi:hypothetical protein